MSARNKAVRALLATAVIVTSGLFGTTAAASAEAATFTVRTGKLIFEPAERGYEGTLTVTVTNTGAEPTSGGVTVLEPIGSSFRGLNPSEPCGFGSAEGRREAGCGLPGGQIQPGKSRRFEVKFRALTAWDVPARTANDTVVTVNLSTFAEPVVVNAETFFRGVDGTLNDPVPYVQDDKSNLDVFAAGARLTKGADGRYTGRLPVIVSSRGDAAHDFVGADLDLPEGIQFEGLFPSEACGGPSCVVPGGQIFEDDARGYYALLGAEGDTPAGTRTGSIRVGIDWIGGPTPDVDESDNTAQFTITVG